LYYKGCLAIQTTTAEHLQEHVEKCCWGTPKDAVRDWLLAGNRFELWGWKRRKVRGQQRWFWEFRSRRITWEGPVGEFYEEEYSEVSLENLE
jgi:hypothetical protein